MGSDKQGVVCDVGLGLQVSSSSPFQQDGINEAQPHQQPNPLSDFAFKSPPFQGISSVSDSVFSAIQHAPLGCCFSRFEF